MSTSDNPSERYLDTRSGLQRMTMRDHFASAAMASIIQMPDSVRAVMTVSGITDAAVAIARLAYEHADAMLAERAKGDR